MNAEDARSRWISLAATVLVNGIIFSSMAAVGMSGGSLRPVEKTIEMIDVDLDDIDWNLAGIPKLGVPRDEKMLPRIQGQAQMPQEQDPLTESDITADDPSAANPDDSGDNGSDNAGSAAVDEGVNLARTKKQAEEEEAVRKAEEQKKKAAADAAARKEAAKKKKEAEKAERQRRMAAAMNSVLDPRADTEDAPIGVPNGSRYGTNTDPNAMSNQSAYISLVSLQLQRQLKVPAVLSPEERKKLQVEVQFFLDGEGKVKGNPKVTKSSGNRFLDDAALSAVRRFGPDSDLKMALPSQAGLKKWVLKEGIRAIVKAR